MERVIEAIGQRIKELRSQKNLTLEELAERSGCTPGFLSQIERNRAVPSIATLDAIAEALGTRVSDFFPDTIKTAKIVRHNQRETFQFEGSSTIYSILSTKFPHAAIDAFLRYGDAHYELRPGDTVHFRSTIKHRLENSGDQPVVLLGLITPAIF